MKTTHSDYRRLSFTRAEIQVCMIRLKGMGIKKAYITGYSEAAISLNGSLTKEM